MDTWRRRAAAPSASELARLAREHDLPMWRAFGMFLEGWATAARGAAGNGLADMRRGVELLRAQNVLIFDGLLKIALAEAEARADDPGRASPSSMKRWRPRITWAIAHSKRNCTASAAKSC
jgi:hypothetical protein